MKPTINCDSYQNFHNFCTILPNESPIVCKQDIEISQRAVTNCFFRIILSHDMDSLAEHEPYSEELKIMGFY